MSERPLRLKHRTRGFTLLEIIIVVAIVALIGMVTIPLVSRAKQKAELNNSARKVLGDLRQARVLGASGRPIDPNASGGGGGGGGGMRSMSSSSPGSGSGSGGTFFAGGETRIRYGGFRIASTTSYVVFGDTDASAGDELDIAVVDFTAKNPSSPIRIVSPPVGTEIRFQSNGTRYSGPTEIVLEDAQSGLRRTVVISPSGAAKFL
jgi:prepilin-type N-terminal cleavage/methylation domain-containing protein